MMLSRAVALTLSALPLLAAATPLETRGSGGSGASSCSTAPIQCCDRTTTAGSQSASALLGLLGIVVQDVNVLVGLNCSPISVIGVGTGDACSGTAVCCEDNSHGGLISIGCLPVTL